jgi:antitoxin component of MazEF toxin-antitoxin module
MHVRKIHKVGHSLVVAVPPEMLDSLGGQCGDYLDWDYSKPGEYVLTLKIARIRLAVPDAAVDFPVHPPVRIEEVSSGGVPGVAG